ncbi:type VI secretion system tip protein VgrG, partial [Aggregatibacter actinomycetemcomitans]|uniref:type VI secretion system Vgr family protein n=1 Tax=Aggregatibacter actinomycetemcomitans TaxID=714 RepID=UPI00197BE685
MAKTVNPDTLVKAAEGVSSVSDKLDLASTLSGNKKVAAKAAKLKAGVSKLQSSVDTGKDVIHRVQQWGQKSNPSAATTPMNLVSGASSSPTTTSLPAPSLSALSSLLGLSPSGLQFTLEAGGLAPATFAVISFECHSRYSELYCLDVAVSSADPAVNPSAVLDNRAVLSVWQDGGLLQTFSGMVTHFEQGDSGFRQTHYRLRIQPDLWRATLRRNSRIFQQKDIQTILSTILSENKVTDYAFVLRYPHPEREFCVQYQESDFDFFQRLTAEEGIFYYFEQQDGQHRLVMTDDATTLSGDTVLPYNVNRNAQLQEKSITSFNRSERVRQSEVTLKDYTFKKPNWQATFNRPANDTQYQRAMYEHYDYPGRFKDGRGEQYTRYRLDSLRQDAHLGWGESNSPNLQVGKLFKLQNHPNASLNTDWQLVGVVYKGQQPQSNELEAGDKATTLNGRFEFMPREQTWRAQQRTKPRVDGPQIAIVTGPAGEEIYTDNFGRVRLQFLWDREGKFDDHSSCWIRVTQPWAGKGWGMMAIPRVGQEIVVDFLDGDPDQPIVTGRTYHANMPLPAALPAGKTQMHVMLQTYKDGGYNGMIMEDATGNQRLDFQAQKDMNTKVLNDQSASIGNNRSLDVT